MRQRQQGTRTRSKVGAPQARPRSGHPPQFRGPEPRGQERGMEQSTEWERGTHQQQPAQLVPWDLPPAVTPDRPSLVLRVLTHTATITTVTVALLVLAVVYFKPGGKPEA